MYIPSELIVYILSFLEKKYINYKSKKCICRTLNNRCCKINTKFIFCHFHRDLNLFQKLSYPQTSKKIKCEYCEKNCINNLFCLRNCFNFCSDKCKNKFILQHPYIQ